MVKVVHNFDVERSELLVDAPIIALRRDFVRMPGGNVAPREIVEHFGAVAVVAVRNGQVAMVRQWRSSVQRRLWELPAGLLDYANEPALECAQRELHEEAGLGAHTWSHLVDLISSPGFCDEAVRVYLAEDLYELEQPAADDEEAELQVQWFDLEEVLAMIHRGEILNAIGMSALFAAARVLDGQAPRKPVDEHSNPFAVRPQRLAERRQADGFHGDMKRK